MTEYMTDRALNRLQDRILNLACNTFGLSADAGAQLVADAQASIESNDRYPNSDGAIERAVASTRNRLLARKARLARD